MVEVSRKITSGKSQLFFEDKTDVLSFGQPVSCGLRFRAQRWGRALVPLLVALLVLVFIWPLLDRNQFLEFRKWIIMGSILLGSAPYFLWEVFFPPAIDITAFKARAFTSWIAALCVALGFVISPFRDQPWQAHMNSSRARENTVPMDRALQRQIRRDQQQRTSRTTRLINLKSLRKCLPLDRLSLIPHR